jgi:hypothetical protein
VLSFLSEAREYCAVKRRDFITLGGAAAMWPLAARAQQGERMRRIGVLSPSSAGDADVAADLALPRPLHDRILGIGVACAA